MWEEGRMLSVERAFMVTKKVVREEWIVESIKGEHNREERGKKRYLWLGGSSTHQERGDLISSREVLTEGSMLKHSNRWIVKIS